MSWLDSCPRSGRRRPNIGKEPTSVRQASFRGVWVVLRSHAGPPDEVLCHDVLVNGDEATGELPQEAGVVQAELDALRQGCFCIGQELLSSQQGHQRDVSPDLRVSFVQGGSLLQAFLRLAELVQAEAGHACSQPSALGIPDLHGA
eukprot:scaffold977_cov253-Pinguiococcus_pyrenoidosus.AAC.31